MVTTAAKTGTRIPRRRSCPGDWGDGFGDATEGALEIELLAKHRGYSPMEAIPAATKSGGEACFMGDRIGTIKTGKLVDIIVVDGDPLTEVKILQDINRIRMVMLEDAVCVDRGL